MKNTASHKGRKRRFRGTTSVLASLPPGNALPTRERASPHPDIGGNRTTYVTETPALGFSDQLRREFPPSPSRRGLQPQASPLSGDRMRYSLRRCWYVSSAKSSVAGSNLAQQSGGTPSKPGWTRWTRTTAKMLAGTPVASACPPPGYFPFTFHPRFTVGSEYNTTPTKRPRSPSDIRAMRHPNRVTRRLTSHLPQTSGFVEE